MAERLYVKLWRSWWTGDSHINVSADALYAGTVLMTFVRWQPGQDDAWAVSEKGRPLSSAIMAARARVSVKRFVAGLTELEHEGTTAIRSDGAWGFVNFGRWQETADASRMRRRRVQNSSRTGGADVPVLGEVEVEGEVEGEIETLRVSPVAPKGASQKTPPAGTLPTLGEASVANGEATASPANDLPGEESPGLLLATSARRPSPTDDLVAHVLAEMGAAVRELTGKPGGPLDCPGNRKLIARCQAETHATAEQWSRVIAAQLASVRSRPETHHFLALSTIARPSNFLRLLDAPAPAPSRTARPEIGARPTVARTLELKTVRPEEPA